MKAKLFLPAVNGGPFTCRPADTIELELDRILCNDVTLPGEFNPHDVRLWVVGNEFGALGAVWGGEHDALDTLVDANLGDGLLIDEEDADDETPRLGNAGEPADLDHAWMREVRLTWQDDAKLIAAFSEARGSGADTLDDTYFHRWQ